MYSYFNSVLIQFFCDFRTAYAVTLPSEDGVELDKEIVLSLLLIISIA